MQRPILGPIALWISLWISACTAHSGSSGQASSVTAPTSAAGVWVSRPDHATSCKSASGQSIEEAALELKKAGVTVLESKKNHDGLSRAQMCGISTGSLNSFRIPAESLETAKMLGFK